MNKILKFGAIAALAIVATLLMCGGVGMLFSLRAL